VQSASEEPWQVKESLEELAELVRTAGTRVIDSLVQARAVPDSALYIGRGKAKQLAERADELEADQVIFDSELSPAQQRNLEDLIECDVTDRTQLILDIFAQRAETKEGKIQVELAQLEYLLPRLTGRGVLMSRLGGGLGGARRGPGETKLEVDRRRIRDRIAKLKRELDSVRRHRDVQRKRRISNEIPSAAIVGYTNAGKSSLLNAVANAGAFVEDKLFATLDPRSRKVLLPSGRTVIFIDTVGFIRKLPHTLIAAFRATLEEATFSDVIILVVDASNMYFQEHIEVAKEILQDLDAAEKPLVTVFNKIDLLPDPSIAGNLVEHTPWSVAISAVAGKNLDQFLLLMNEVFSMDRERIELIIPQWRSDVEHFIRRRGKVLEKTYRDGKVVISAELDKTTAAQVREFTKEE
jgi:GTP-binding protein HflX